MWTVKSFLDSIIPKPETVVKGTLAVAVLAIGGVASTFLDVGAKWLSPETVLGSAKTVFDVAQGAVKFGWGFAWPNVKSAAQSSWDSVWPNAKNVAQSSWGFLWPNASPTVVSTSSSLAYQTPLAKKVAKTLKDGAGAVYKPAALRSAGLLFTTSAADTIASRSGTVLHPAGLLFGTQASGTWRRMTGPIRAKL